MESVSVRPGAEEDLPQVLALIKELAEYEKAPHAVTNTVEMMRENGFGPHPIFGFLVAEKNEEVIGLSLYYYRYSTWKGRRLYLEDIIVTQKERGNGYGKLLFNRTMQQCLDDKCSGMVWQVLDWNEPAINFYKQFGASLDSEWINCSLKDSQIRDLIAINQNGVSY